MRRPRLRLALHGLLGGVLLSLLRAPLGLDWTQLPAVSGTTAAFFRAGALLGLALAIVPGRSAFREGLAMSWLAGLALGYAGHGLELLPFPALASRASFALTLVVGTILLRALAGRPPRDVPPLPPVLGRRGRFGLVLVGIGAALAFETLAHEVRLFTLGLAADDTVVGSVFLLLVCAGALAFAPLAQRFVAEGARVAGGVALASGACVFGLAFLARLTPAGLHAHLQRSDRWLELLRSLDSTLGDRLGIAGLPMVDGTSIGTLWTTALLASAAFVVPCFLLGAAVGGVREIGRIRHLLIGAAFGLCLRPTLVQALARPLEAEEIWLTSWSWPQLMAAACLAGAGALAVATIERGRQRWTGVVIALLALALPWVRPRIVLWSFSPWAVAPIEPELVVPTSAGLVTLERARGGHRIVTLDRRRVSPSAEEEGVDEREFRAAWSLLPEEQRARGIRGLLIGQITPARSHLLRGLGTLDLDRTAPWSAAFPALEELLFRGEEPPLGRVLPPGEARARLRDGEYDWVIAPPVRGPVLLWRSEAREAWASAEAPLTERLTVAEGTLGVAWVRADSRIARRPLPGSVLLALERCENLSVGLLQGEARTGGLDLPPRFPPGEPLPGPSVLGLLCTLPVQRAFVLERALAGRLAGATAEPATPAAELARGLALHFSAQTLSSPYETRAQQIELDEEALRAFYAALPVAPGTSQAALDPFTRELWEALAWLVTEKRLPELAWAYLEPVAERFGPWPALDRAVARAYREMLEPESAMRFLERALEREPHDIELLAECADTAREIPDPARARGFLERALAIQPHRADLERALGIALLEAGDPSGREILERLRISLPDDPEILRALREKGGEDGSDG